MTTTLTTSVLEQLIGTIEIRPSDYQRAAKRYEDVSAWFHRREAETAPFSPRVYPQGSFRLGTVIRPVDAKGEYDLDLGCRLENGITKQSHSQRDLKLLVGRDLEAYRTARGIQSKLEPMHRCWRLKYSDEVTFHMDTVPSIPESVLGRIQIQAAITIAGEDAIFAGEVANLTGAITDDRHPHYSVIADNWRVSNSEGYARWFERRMKLAGSLLKERAARANVAQIESLPAYEWKSPLQACVQVLKRHRDVMFSPSPDSKPISIIITTLAARAYQGEANILDTLSGVLSRMGGLVNSRGPKVPNPVNPAEDFADKWADAKYAHLRLEQNFWRWLEKARNDFQALTAQSLPDPLLKTAREAFAVPLDPNKFPVAAPTVGASLLSAPVNTGNLSFPHKPLIPSKPSGFA